MRIYVTGLTGLVGRHLAPLLVARGDEVAGGDRVDVCDAAAVERAIVAARPAWVIHLAAYTRVDDAERDPAAAARVNIAGTVHVAGGARAAGARLLYMSTDYVYDGEKHGPYQEDDRPRPISAYGRTKLGGEIAAEAIVPDCLIVRGGWLYGPGKGFVDRILARAAGQQQLAVVTDETGSPTQASDLARGLVALVGAEASGIVHVANGGGTSRFELARAALRLAGEDPARVVPTTQAENGRPARRPRSSVLACTRFASLTGSGLRPWEEALAAHMRACCAGRASQAGPTRKAAP